MKILIIGGTRQIGYYLALDLLHAGYDVTLLNRGKSRDTLPKSLPRIRCDRTDNQQLRRKLQNETYDVVVDNVLYNGEDAEAIIDLLDGRVGQYIFLSSGQVYLVREGLKHRPVSEEDYPGQIIERPQPVTYDYEEWNYGVGKRRAEDALHHAWTTRGFPYTSLRLPMVNSDRDRHKRLYSYMLRIKDGGPILAPDGPDHSLRHIYVHDIVRAIRVLIDTQTGQGQAYNISQDESVSLDTFLGILGEALNMPVRIVRKDRTLLESHSLMPDCSPFSDVWMSELDNARSKNELGMIYTPLHTYLKQIVESYEANPPLKPSGYSRRAAEIKLAEG